MPPKGTMCGERMPNVEREVFAGILLPQHFDLLAREQKVADRSIWGFAFWPLHAGVFDGHRSLGGAQLHLELKQYLLRSECFIERQSHCVGLGCQSLDQIQV